MVKVYKQVDIPISKNQTLQMLCLKHHVYKTLKLFYIKNGFIL